MEKDNIRQFKPRDGSRNSQSSGDQSAEQSTQSADTSFSFVPPLMGRNGRRLSMRSISIRTVVDLEPPAVDNVTKFPGQIRPTSGD